MRRMDDRMNEEIAEMLQQLSPDGRKEAFRFIVSLFHKECGTAPTLAPYPLGKDAEQSP